MRFTLVLFLFCCDSILGQAIPVSLLNSEELAADRFVGVDALENIYYIKENVFFKKNGKKIYNYQHVNLGNLSSADVHNPFKIILFYQDFNSVVVLDNNLNEHISAISLFGLNYHLVSFAAENNLWLYSRDNNVFQLFDFQKKEILFNAQPLGFFQPNFIAQGIKSDNRNLWLTGNSGILTFNQYGSFLEFTELEGAENIFPAEGGWIFQKENSFFYQRDSRRLKLDLPPDHEVKDLFTVQDRLFIFDGQTLYTYRFTISE